MDLKKELKGSERLVRLAETFSQSLRGLSGTSGGLEPNRFFPPGMPRPGDPRYDHLFDDILADFPAWLDPGEIGVPAARDTESRDELVLFPSPLPCGQAAVDRVAVKLYPDPPLEGGPRGRSPRVGVLFHHWLGFSSWLPVDWLLGPLTERMPVAAMVAPHHLSRSMPGFASGDGFIHPNPLAFYEASRQWHLATCELLRRDHGWDEVVVVGYSLGGYGALLHRLIRPAPPTVVICVTNDYARGVFESPRTEDLRRGLDELSFSREHFSRLTRPLHLADWAPRLGGEKLTWIYARYDTIEPPESLLEAREKIAPEIQVEVAGGHASAALDRQEILKAIAERVEKTARGLG